MTSSFSQPEPFDPAALPPTPRRAASRSNQPLLMIVAAVVLAVVSFGGGFFVANATATKATTFPGADGQGLRPNASGRPRNGFGGGASGTVGSVSADQMTITTASGGQRIVLLTPTTKVTEVSSTTKAVSDLASGLTVTIVGTANPDGSVTATNVVIGNAGLLGRGGFGGFGGGDGAPGPSPTP